MAATLPPANERTLAARVAAFSLHAQRDSREVTKPARAAFLSRFEKEVDPDGTLPPQERQRRADAAKRAYFTRLSLRSVKARRRKRLSL